AGTCNSATGICSNPNKANDTACDDANACTQSDTCQFGTCVSGAPVICAALSQCRDIGVCDSVTGMCTNPSKADGTACTNGADGTEGTCQSGDCVSNVPLPMPCTSTSDCPELFECTDGKCQPVATGPLDSVDGCSCSTPGNPSSSPSIAMLFLAATAFFVRRKPALATRSRQN
ncbi:MAG TPA: hypothetical protein PK156_38680, partial [Polyangium sp.]|nr:hypothetical protein [Polyangium sp.]